MRILVQPHPSKQFPKYFRLYALEHSSYRRRFISDVRASKLWGVIKYLKGAYPNE